MGRGGGTVNPVEAKPGEELRMPLAASPASAGVARALVERRLRAWGFGEAARYDACLVLTELVSNAVAVTPVGAYITLHCRRDALGVVIGVGDRDTRVPHSPPPVVEVDPANLDLRPEHFDDNGGWGLTIVAALADGCGVTRPASGGKIVWARLRA